MRSGNPALRAETFSRLPRVGDDRAMTLDGTVNKSGLLLLLAVAGAGVTWQVAAAGSPLTPILMGAGLVGGLVLAIATVFKQTWAPVTAPLYAAAEGLFLGGVTLMAEESYPGIAIQAVSLTFGILFALLLAYKSHLIKATENFKLGVVAATGGIFLIYLASFVLGFFGIQMPMIHSNGTVGILFSVGVVVIAALNLVLDFDFIEQGAANQAPKYMEWYGAFGLMVTLVWLYLEVLRLLMKVNSRR